ncbi:hypothetical protein FZC33_12710 [Labrys sp. KNU-23]|uniref:hypothetical protein n=1 Tax=Labrys sp. KNU-23 TaxID=2789216 RepID=UPI0011EC0A45|nr:hypothetical protein [Labrys sp. KNU-23]QEN87136.1 hypothetical protein FZC33_12710 [Labrys sp. KNU-23]
MRLLICAAVFAALTFSVQPSTALAASCSERITFVQHVIDGDVKTGFVDKKVHDVMSRDLAEAGQACKAGDVAKAQSLISSTQRRHGYPVR